MDSNAKQTDEGDTTKNIIQKGKEKLGFGEALTSPEAPVKAQSSQMANQLAVKKLSEAVALCGMGAELLAKHEQLLSAVMDHGELTQKRERFNEDTNRSRECAEELASPAEVASQVELEGQKFTDMYDVFMRDEKEEPMTVISWLGIASAGGIAIWSVLRTLAAQMDHADLEELSERALNFQKQNLADGEEALTQLAKQAT
jgi:hypothetical protein